VWTDPQTRDIIQTVFFRKVETVENVKDPVKARMTQCG
jgi:hypothetical protein